MVDGESDANARELQACMRAVVRRRTRRRVEVVVRGKVSQVRHVVRVLRRADAGRGLAVRVPPVLASRYGIVETTVERAQIGASSQIALEKIFDSLVGSCVCA